MKQPDISILIPHLRESSNDKALKIAIDCIIDNTDIDYELMIEAVAERRDIYAALNSMTSRARAEWVVYSNSDVFFAPGWASAMYEGRDYNSITTGIIAECGAIGVNSINYELHCGVTPEEYNRFYFERWVEKEGTRIYGDKAAQSRGWFFPCLLNQSAFLDFGGFDLSYGYFPRDPVDAFTWDKWEKSGRGFKRVNSWCYHLQNFSSDDEGRIQGRANMHKPEPDTMELLRSVFICEKCGLPKTHYRLYGYRCDRCLD